jgi:DNA polymerase-2
MPIDQSQRGLLPETLRPLLEKRVAIKQRLARLTHQDCRTADLKSRSTALKWLLVVAFGYAGYKRARFGRIEAHEAITAYSREAMLRAKETAEAAGYEVLHMYVDGLWLKRPGGLSKEGIHLLLADITECTGLPIALEGIYRWLAFLPSKLDARVPVPNRYFGIFSDNSLKLRGIEARRRDTPPFITQLQLDIFKQLAKTADITQTSCWLPGILILIHRCLDDLHNGRIPLEHLLISQTLSRAVAAYKTPSPAARAAMQLQRVGKLCFPGQRIRFVYTLGVDGVHAWDLADTVDEGHIDKQYYTKLICRAAASILQPLGLDEAILQAWVLGHAWQRPLPLTSQRNQLECKVWFNETAVTTVPPLTIDH